MANYSGLMSVDETSTVDALTVTRRIAREELDLHGGWLFGLPGDGIFALFESAVDAVKCALETQQRLLAMSRLSTMRLRIGVHLGEVVFQDGLPYGEALVIAARLESHAEPGGVLVSAAVMDAVAPRIAAQFCERGVFNLKHSPRRITTYSVSVDEPSRNLDLSSGAGEVLDRTILSVPATFGPEDPPAAARAVPFGLVARQELVPDLGGPSERTEPVLAPAHLDPVPDTVSLVEPADPVRPAARPDPWPETIVASEPAEPVRPPPRPDPAPDMAHLPEPADPLVAPVAQHPRPDTVSLSGLAEPVPAPARPELVPDTVSLSGPAEPVPAPARPELVPDTVSLSGPVEPVPAPARPELVPDTVSLSGPADPLVAPVAQHPRPDTVSLSGPAEPVPAPARPELVPDTVSLSGPAEPVPAPARPELVPDTVSLSGPAEPVPAPARPELVPDTVSLSGPAESVPAPARPELIPDTVSLPKATPLIVRSLDPEAELGRGEPPPIRTFAPTVAEVVLSPDCAEEFIQALTQHIGPVAGVLVRRLASRYADPLEFIDALADEIPAEEERLQFRMRARHVIRRQHS